MFILECLWFFLPAGIANMTPVLVRKINFLNIPVDFGKKYKGEPIFGSHKTFRGFFFGILVAIGLVYLQKLLYQNYDFFNQIAIIPYDRYNVLLLGFLMGFGALFGDLVKSYIKRRMNVKPGKKFVPWDQIDFIIGFLFFVSIIYIPPVSVIIFLLVAIPFFHIGINFLGYYLKVQNTKW